MPLMHVAGVIFSAASCTAIFVRSFGALLPPQDDIEVSIWNRFNIDIFAPAIIQ
jgi:hypothetical protein